jgi:scyllo-inositol 2-dehydrogenase (NADP+)
MIRAALVGLGKMGLSHFAILNAHPDVQIVGVCDNARYMLDLLEKYAGVPCFQQYTHMLDEARPEAVLIATPSRLHGPMVRAALTRGIHVFCEKPFSLDPADGEQLAALARTSGLVNQIGYHYRYVATYQEMAHLLAAECIGQVHHVQADAYGPVVLKAQSATWRSDKAEGGGCLYDYACHVIDLVTFMFGPPVRVSGTRLGKIFSASVDDEVHTLLHFRDGKTAQINANWSDASNRKMTTSVTAWGTNGKIHADRQELQMYMRSPNERWPNLRPGWTIRNITNLEAGAWYYLRGEEYSAQIAGFVEAVQANRLGTSVVQPRSSFASALETDKVVAMMQADACGHDTGAPMVTQPESTRRPLFSRRLNAKSSV